MSKYIDADALLAEIERLLARANRRTDKEHLSHNSEMEKFGEDYWNGYGDFAYGLLGYVESLQQEQKTGVPSATPAVQAENLTFEEYLRGVFEINSGIENDPDNLVKIHAPELLKLARKQEQPEVDLEKEMDSYFESVEVQEHENIFEETFQRIAKHFYELGKKTRII